MLLRSLLSIPNLLVQIQGLKLVVTCLSLPPFYPQLPAMLPSLTWTTLIIQTHWTLKRTLSETHRTLRLTTRKSAVSKLSMLRQILPPTRYFASVQSATTTTGTLSAVVDTVSNLSTWTVLGSSMPQAQVLSATSVS